MSLLWKCQILRNEKILRGTWSVSRHEIGDRQLSGIEHDQTLGPLLVHDSVAALPAPDRVTGPDLILTEI